ncbi:helix-turn-helix domain-containing protein [Pseudomonas syringae]|uniref:Cro/Cl family transcriptional regulator n=1 Tax=Pseudomonas syringae TaxID=317 RepID=A0A085V7B7_PSESX|nr:helix-turn-helix transcriptional regulator [Pseudomonas syringae]KFE51330.1 Cro/Cl family transcriptional regulator [Pseudomonas syringae]
MNGLGSRLKEERKALGLSQQDFAAIGGVEANAQGKYENGQRTPRSNYLTALDSSGVDVLYLLSGRRTPMELASLSETERAVIVRLRSLTVVDQAAIGQLTLSLSECLPSPFHCD